MGLASRACVLVRLELRDAPGDAAEEERDDEEATGGKGLKGYLTQGKTCSVTEAAQKFQLQSQTIATATEK